MDVEPADDHKHLGFVLDRKMSSNKHVGGKTAKANRGIGMIRHLYTYLPRKALLQIYKSFLQPRLDYCDVIYHSATYNAFYRKYYSERTRTDSVNTNFHYINRIEAVQYNAALAITGGVRGSSREKLYCELGLNSLYDRRRFHRLSLLYKIVNHFSVSTVFKSLNPIYGIHDLIGLKYLTHLHVGLSHLRAHKFYHDYLIVLPIFLILKIGALC